MAMVGGNGNTVIIWLHGLGDNGRANEPIKNLFTSSKLGNTKWLFPTAPSNPVTCNRGFVMPSWFDIHEMPMTPKARREEKGVVEAVKHVHAMIDEEIASGTPPANVFVCGLSQGGALTAASVMLYPKTLGGGAVFSGWFPFDDHSAVSKQFPEDAKKTPMLWCHGMLDLLVTFEAGQDGHLYVQRAGFGCEFKAYSELGHSLSGEELKYLESWIESRLGTTSPASTREETQHNLIQKAHNNSKWCCISCESPTAD